MQLHLTPIVMIKSLALKLNAEKIPPLDLNAKAPSIESKCGEL